MTLYRAQVSAAADSTLPRDRVVNTLYFDDHGVTTDPDGLATDLAEVFNTGWYTRAPHEIDVRFYDLADAEPRPIKGRHIANAGAAPASQLPREVALCLSYYGGRNLPRQRGRIYLFVPGHTSGLAVRPGATIRADALALASAFAGLGGLDVDWVVHSTLGDPSRNVDHAWVDDEWDTVRKRGLRATTRDAATVGP